MLCKKYHSISSYVLQETSSTRQHTDHDTLFAKRNTLHWKHSLNRKWLTTFTWWVLVQLLGTKKRPKSHEHSRYRKTLWRQFSYFKCSTRVTLGWHSRAVERYYTVVKVGKKAQLIFYMWTVLIYLFMELITLWGPIMKSLIPSSIQV